MMKKLRTVSQRDMLIKILGYYHKPTGIKKTRKYDMLQMAVGRN